MNPTENAYKKTSHMHWTHILLIVIFTIVITIAGTYWVLKTYIFTTLKRPVDKHSSILLKVITEELDHNGLSFLSNPPFENGNTIAKYKNAVDTTGTILLDATKHFR